VLATARVEEIDAGHPVTSLRLDLQHDDQWREVELGPLTADETASLAAQVAGHQLTTDQTVAIYQQTEGNPLFVVETVRAGLAASLQKQLDSGVHQSELHAYSLSPKVYAVIQARLAQLSPPAQELVALAAASGRSFTFPVLAAASQLDEASLIQHLDELWRRRIIRAQEANAYDFSHDRIREAAYAGISPIRRPQLHRRIAEALAAVYVEELDTVAAQLAAHYEQAGLLEAAIDWRYQAAQVQQRLHAHSGAIEHLNAGLALLARLPESAAHRQQTVSFLLALEPSLIIARGFTVPEIEQALSRARELLRVAGDRRQLFAVLRGLHNFYIARRGLLAAHDLSQELFQIAQELDDPRLLAEAYRRDARAHLHLGEFAWASRQIEQGVALLTSGRPLDLANPPPDPFDTGVTFFPNQALLLWVLGYPEQAQARAALAIQYAEQYASPFSLHVCCYITSISYRELRDVTMVQRLADEGMITLGARYEIALAHEAGLACQGWVLAQQGDFEKAIAWIGPEIEGLRLMDYTMFQTYLLGKLADVCLRAGRLAQAEATLSEALSLSEQYHERCWDAELHRLHGDLALAQGDATQAERDYLRALETARHQEAKSLELRAAMGLARLWQQQDKGRQAHDVLAAVYGWFTEGFATPDLQDAKCLLNELSLS
jgi:tetratricopeptide (TPR) repeat protein